MYTPPHTDLQRLPRLRSISQFRMSSIASSDIEDGDFPPQPVCQACEGKHCKHTRVPPCLLAMTPSDGPMACRACAGKKTKHTRAPPCLKAPKPEARSPTCRAFEGGKVKHTMVPPCKKSPSGEANVPFSKSQGEPDNVEDTPTGIFPGVRLVQLARSHVRMMEDEALQLSVYCCQFAS
jgi:hypothetical protein